MHFFFSLLDFGRHGSHPITRVHTSIIYIRYLSILPFSNWYFIFPDQIRHSQSEFSNSNHPVSHSNQYWTLHLLSCSIFNYRFEAWTIQESINFMEFLILSHVSPSPLSYHIPSIQSYSPSWIGSSPSQLFSSCMYSSSSSDVSSSSISSSSSHYFHSSFSSCFSSHVQCIHTLFIGKDSCQDWNHLSVSTPPPSPLPSSSSFSCVAWHPSSHLFSDVYIALLWLIVSIYRSYSLVSPPDFDKSDEVWVSSLLFPSLTLPSLRIESMPAISNGLAIDQSLVVFEHSLAKNVRPFPSLPSDLWSF